MFINQFRAGDIIQPRHKGATPGTMLRVTEIVGDMLHAAPSGGGFVCELPNAVAKTFDFVKVESDDCLLRKTTFEHDCYPGEHFHGYDRGSRWNGWAKPYVTDADMRKLAKLTQDDENDENCQFVWNKGNKSLNIDPHWEMFDPYSDEYIAIDDIEINGEKCWDLGPIGWTWSSNATWPSDPFAELISAARIACFPDGSGPEEPYSREDGIKRLEAVIRLFDHVEV